MQGTVIYEFKGYQLLLAGFKLNRKTNKVKIK